jgi:hypothetical protein
MKSAYQLKFIDGCSIPSNVLTMVVPKGSFRDVREVLGDDIGMILRDNGRGR